MRACAIHYPSEIVPGALETQKLNLFFYSTAEDPQNPKPEKITEQINIPGRGGGGGGQGGGGGGGGEVPQATWTERRMKINPEHNMLKVRVQAEGRGGATSVEWTGEGKLMLIWGEIGICLLILLSLIGPGSRAGLRLALADFFSLLASL